MLQLAKSIKYSIFIFIGYICFLILSYIYIVNCNNFKSYLFFSPSHPCCLSLFSTSFFCILLVFLFCDSLSLTRAFCVVISLEVFIEVWWTWWLSIPQNPSVVSTIAHQGVSSTSPPCPFMADYWQLWYLTGSLHKSSATVNSFIVLAMPCCFSPYLLAHTFLPPCLFGVCSLSLRGGGIMSYLGL